MTTNTDAAREAARFIVEQTFKNPTYDGDPSIADLAIDTYLAKVLEGADEKLVEIRERHLSFDGATLSKIDQINKDRAELLTLVSALSAEKQELAMQALSLSGELETLQSELAATRKALELAQKWLVNSVPTKEIDGPKPLPVIADILDPHR